MDETPASRPGSEEPELTEESSAGEAPARAEDETIFGSTQAAAAGRLKEIPPPEYGWDRGGP
jgi:hypothetical protein